MDNHEKKQLLDKYIIELLNQNHGHYKIDEDGKIILQILCAQEYAKSKSQQRTVDNCIFNHITQGFIFSKPCSPYLAHSHHKTILITHELEEHVFKPLLSRYSVGELRQMDCMVIPKEIFLDNYRELFKEDTTSAFAIYNLLSHLALHKYYYEDMKKALKISLSYIHQHGECLDSMEQRFIEDFIALNSKFFRKSDNKSWFVATMKQLGWQGDVGKILDMAPQQQLFIKDTWHHATIELCRQSLYMAYPIHGGVSSHGMQSTYKSILSQFATFLASHDESQKWMLNVQQAHLVSKKNGNYLFYLAHSSQLPQVHKIQQCIHAFLDYIHPALSSEKSWVTPEVNQKMADKHALCRLISSLVLFNQLDANMEQHSSAAKRAKV